MACCNSSCVQCSEWERNRRDDMDAYWKRIHEGSPDLNPEEKKMHLKHVHNKKIYAQVTVLQKQIEWVMKGIK